MLQIYDLGVPEKSTIAAVHVNVVDVNDNSPVFEQDEYVATIAEDLASNAFIIQVLRSGTFRTALLFSYRVQRFKTATTMPDCMDNLFH